MLLPRIAAQFRKARRRGFTLIEIIVAMAVLAILAAGVINILSGQAANAHTGNAVQTLDQLKTAMAVFQAQNGAYPAKGTPASDTVNANTTANTGSASYNALVADLQAVGIYNLPPYGNVFGSWTYQPGNGTTPPTYTVFGTGANGTDHVICVDPTNGVRDLGSGGAPATPGVSCL